MQKSKNNTDIRRAPGVEEMLEVIQEQKRFIESLKQENLRLQQHVAALENDRGMVLQILAMTQKNADEILRHTQEEADEMLDQARAKAEKQMADVDGYVRGILDAEDSLEGLLGLLQEFRQHMLQIDEMRLQDGVAAALQEEHYAAFEEQII